MNTTKQEPLNVLLEKSVSGIGFRKVTYADGWQCPVHHHDNARIVFVLKGAFSESGSRGTKECLPFSVIYRPPGEKHSEHYRGPEVTCVSADLSPEWSQRLEDRQLLMTRPSTVQTAGFAPLILRLNDELTRPDDVSDLAVETLILESAIRLYRQEASPEKRPRWMDLVEEFLTENSSSKLTLATLASVAGVHTVHLARTFRRIHNCTVAEYIRGTRTRAAATLLITTARPLAAVAAESGFSDQSHFSRVFRRHTGFTPAGYRRQFGPRANRGQ